MSVCFRILAFSPMAPCSQRADAVEPPLEEGVMAKSLVNTVPAAPSTVALEHFQRELAFEVDPADVHDAMSTGEPGIVVVDVRGPDKYTAGHVPRSEEHTSELQSLMRLSYAVSCLKNTT